MASTTVTWSPTSLQLRLALNCQSSSCNSPSVLVRSRFKKLNRPVHLRCFGPSAGRRRGCSLSIRSESNAESFSGWSESGNDGEQSIESQKKGGLGGIVQAGVAGVVLFAGLTFAALSLSKRSTSRPREQMEPLTAAQDVSIVPDHKIDKFEEYGYAGNNVKQDDRSLESKIALQVLPGKVLVPAVVDQVQGQALSALQVLKVIEADVKPGDLCIRREYARWLVSASSTLTRSTMSKVYPAMYIENVTDLAFDDITPEDPDFSSIQGLAEAGLISSKLSHRDLLNEEPGPIFFLPESPLSRQDLVSWKMALEKRQLPEANKKILYQLSGFIDIDKINPDAWPALLADLTAGEQGIIALAFGCTRLFQPDKPVTNAQAAVALAIGEASDAVNEELQRIEAESAAENAVSEHSALVAEVEKEINESFEKELSMEREKIDVVEKMAEEARQELERLRAEREVDKIALMKERAAIESEMEILSKLRREVEEQLESLMSNKVEISYEKERINMLRKEAENENQEIARLQYELEVERKALSMARAWAEDEAKRAREQAKALEGARDRWERQGIKVVVDKDLREESDAAVMWVNAGKQFSVDQTVSRAQSLVDKLKAMANDVSGKSKEIINTIIHKILLFISNLKKWASKASMRAAELKDATILKAKGSVQELQQSTAEFRSNLTEGAKRVAGDCREGVEKLTQRFKT
ncbi:GPI-anchored adhesin-like protein [Citrus sinensis]|uniref:GPI-anchored adhesin-like protein n=1 Tax=Citrus sinensis TaxID=2711 RepID=A0ACB8HSI9_CITSI|nr:GPI-anchored adhesin-like protein [Citrus sinensis]